MIVRRCVSSFIALLRIYQVWCTFSYMLWRAMWMPRSSSSRNSKIATHDHLACIIWIKPQVVFPLIGMVALGWLLIVVGFGMETNQVILGSKANQWICIMHISGTLVNRDLHYHYYNIILCKVDRVLLLAAIATLGTWRSWSHPSCLSWQSYRLLLITEYLSWISLELSYPLQYLHNWIILIFNYEFCCQVVALHSINLC